MNDDDRDTNSPETTELTRIAERLSATPERIGPYRILQTLGEGGMGLVYEAEQEKPVRRRVALKVIKRGMDTDQVVVRFESERQALALMNHPNIARVYDAGATEDGRPYFVMESVPGIPITDYCDRHKLSTRQRLELFIQVCNGVQHAHQKGIIHRDIKPSNVLVRDEDNRHVPKIIDFGIAKATAQRLTEKTFFTEMGQLVGTPEYMSPEQAEMRGMDIDTRTDVYLLGLLLYEVLTGVLPFDSREIRRAGFNAYRRRVLEEDPAKPSTRITALRDSGERPDPGQSLERKSLSRQLRGDLDWITMKALEKDRTRRYPSASELAADIERYLKHEPVLAGPPSNVYRLRKFVRRHNAGVAFAGVLLVLLAGFAATMAVQRNQIARAHDIARQERDRATREARIVGEVASFLENLFKVSDPSEAQGRRITAREILDRGAQKIRQDLADSPEVQARLMSIMGDVYSSHGLDDPARSLLESALQIQLESPGSDDLMLATTLERLAGLLAVEYGELARARRLYRRGLEIRLRILGPDDPDVARCMNDLANVLNNMGEYSEALKLYGEAFRILEANLDPDDPSLAPSLNNQAAMLKIAGDYDGARKLFERALEIRRKALARDHPSIAWSLISLGKLHDVAGDHELARDCYEEALGIRERVLSPDHPRLAENLVLLAMLKARQGDGAGAKRLHDRAVTIYEKTNSFENPFVLYYEAAYAALMQQTDVALRYLREAVVEHEYSPPQPLAEDPNLVSLRGDSEFEAIVAAVRRRGAGPPP